MDLPKNLKDGNRDTFRNGCHSGQYDGVAVIIRCEDAYKYTSRFDTDLIKSLPKSVKFICAPQVGYDQMNVNTCTIRGIAVSNSPANIGNATAHATIYLLLGALRRSWISSLSIQNGQWRGYARLGHDPEGKVLGILGMGNTPPGTKYVSFEELLRTSDIISIHLPLSDDTRYTLGSNEFAQMKDGAILINASRGPIIDEQALVDALESANENVVLTPHMAAGTVETIHKSEALAMSNVRNALQHGDVIDASS
ncbi:uncharacterized protein EAF01_004672 [Botrytis porri]|nr:uncharacterized protein EAF01_004672 [Botrytis porri]KAF7907085.1 hypothetical protein EAF01_004672 [Botrytis porri]